MKFISKILEDIEGIATFYNIGLLVFVIFFVVVLIRTYKMPKKEAEEIKNSILD